MTSLLELCNEGHHHLIGYFMESHLDETVEVVKDVDVTKLTRHGLDNYIKVVVIYCKSLELVTAVIEKLPHEKHQIVQTVLMNRRNLDIKFIEWCQDLDVDLHDLTLPWLKNHSLLKLMIDKDILDLVRFCDFAIHLSVPLSNFDDVFCYWKGDSHSILASCYKNLLSDYESKNHEDESYSKFKRRYFAECDNYISKLHEK